jgi:hypothetical protein
MSEADSPEPPPSAPQPLEEQSVEIHKPKPVHSWRELLTEIGVVVIGVSIALAAEQTVEWLHWRTQVAEARAVLATEMAQNVRTAIWRMRTANCVEHRLDELAAIVDTAAKTGSLPPVGDIGTSQRAYWFFNTWDSVVASQTATHFPRQQLADITFVYTVIAGQGARGVDEAAAWQSLYAMVGPGRRLDAASEARLREALSQARTFNRLITAASNSIAVRANTLGLSFSAADLALIAQGKRQQLQLTHDPSPTLIGNFGTPFGAICAPIGGAPSHYGQGYYGAVPLLIDDAVKNLPDYAGRAP